MPISGKNGNGKMEDVKLKKRTHVRPGEKPVRKTCLLKTQEALFLPVAPCYRDDSGNYHITEAYVILREDWEDYNDFLFAPSLEAIQRGRFVSQIFEDGIVKDVLEKVYIDVAKKDFLELVKKHLETE